MKRTVVFVSASAFLLLAGTAYAEDKLSVPPPAAAVMATPSVEPVAHGSMVVVPPPPNPNVTPAALPNIGPDLYRRGMPTVLVPRRE